MALSPQRQQLADRIARRRAVETERTTLAKAATPAWQAMRAAEDALAAARADVEKAAQRAADHRIAVLAGGPDDAPPPPVENARQRVRMAEDDLAAARAALAAIEERRRANETAPPLPQDVENAARAVMWEEARPQLRAVIDAVRTAQLDYARAWAVASFLHGLVPPYRYPDDAEAAELRSVVYTIDTPPAHWDGPRDLPDPAQRWRHALDALQRDAGAKLPR